MPRIAREGDTSDHGGAPIGVDGAGVNPNVTVNSRPIAIGKGVGDGANGPCGLWEQNSDGGPSDDTHPLGRLPGSGGIGIPGPVNGSPSVFVAGVPVHRFNDARGCGAETITASPNVWADFLEEIRVEGATVVSSIESPAAPKSFSYSPIFFFSFSFDEEVICEDTTFFCDPEKGWSDEPWVEPGMFYVAKKGVSLNNLFTSKTDDTNTWGIYSDNFEKWGSEIKPTLEFEDLDDKFKVPDIDFARRTDLAPTALNFAGGLRAEGFPSYGTTPIDSLGIIKGVVDDDNGCTLFQWFEEVEEPFPGFPSVVMTNTSQGYPFQIANESGKVTGYAILVTIPWSRFHNTTGD